MGGIDLLHTLSYKGMGVFPGRGSDLPTQLWIIARYLESLALLAAPFFIKRRLRIRVTFAAVLAVTVLALLAVFAWGVFPVCFEEGSGLTPFKKISEYVICKAIVETGLKRPYDLLFRKITTLHGLLPICASCKKIRDNKGYWNKLEEYISTHSEASFTHGICPDCIKELYPYLAPKEEKEEKLLKKPKVFLQHADT